MAPPLLSSLLTDVYINEIENQEVFDHESFLHDKNTKGRLNEDTVRWITIAVQKGVAERQVTTPEIQKDPIEYRIRWGRLAPFFCG